MELAEKTGFDFAHARARMVAPDALSLGSRSTESGMLTASQEVDIRPADQVLDRIVLAELCEANQ